MTLTKCKECGREVAASAPTCPGCGVKNPAGYKAHITTLRGLVLIILVIIAVIVLLADPHAFR